MIATRTLAIASGCALTALVAPSTASAFRTASDTAEFATAGKVRWAEDTIHYVLHADGAPGLSAAVIEPVMLDALRAWSDVSSARLSFDYLGTSSDPSERGDATNTMEWVRSQWSARGFSPDQAAATDVQYAELPSGEWQIVEADIYLNAEHFSWTINATVGADSRDVLTVLRHEAGHALGLLHVCELDPAAGAPDCENNPEFESSVMHPSYTVGLSGLSLDDQEGVSHLYSHTPIEDTRDCQSGSCSAGGYCGQRCESQADCADGAVCDEQATCVSPEGLPLGAECDAAADCDSGLCLSDHANQHVCTRLCDQGDAVCPMGWLCEVVEDTAVCVEQVVTPAGGCAISAFRPTAGGTGLCIVYWVLGGLRRRKRR